jgi:hypothetical protein
LTTRHPEAEQIARTLPLSEVAKVEPVARELYGVKNFVITREAVQVAVNSRARSAYGLSHPALSTAFDILEARIEATGQAG